MTTANAGNEFAAQTQAALHDERVRLLYRHLAGGAHRTAATTVDGMDVPLGVIIGGRLVLYRRFAALPAAAAGLSMWGRVFVAGALAMGCLWGCLGVLWLPRGELAQQLLVVAVNLSARQFGREGLAERIAASFSESGLEARHLELEITESAVKGNAERAVAILDELQAIGVRVALDDFGSGYSSLGYLKRFPVDSVQIDRSFIAKLPHDQDDIAITRAVIAMAHSLRLTVVAEGVETGAQERFLREHDCDEMQGYRCVQPCDAEALARLLAAPPLTPSA